MCSNAWTSAFISPWVTPRIVMASHTVHFLTNCSPSITAVSQKVAVSHGRAYESNTYKAVLFRYLPTLTIVEVNVASWIKFSRSGVHSGIWVSVRFSMKNCCWKLFHLLVCHLYLSFVNENVAVKYFIQIIESVSLRDFFLCVKCLEILYFMDVSQLSDVHLHLWLVFPY